MIGQKLLYTATVRVWRWNRLWVWCLLLSYDIEVDYRLVYIGKSVSCDIEIDYRLIFIGIVWYRNRFSVDSCHHYSNNIPGRFSGIESKSIIVGYPSLMYTGAYGFVRQSAAANRSGAKGQQSNAFWQDSRGTSGGAKGQANKSSYRFVGAYNRMCAGTIMRHRHYCVLVLCELRFVLLRVYFKVPRQPFTRRYYLMIPVAYHSHRPRVRLFRVKNVGAASRYIPHTKKTTF